jgi:hypothetical protein
MDNRGTLRRRGSTYMAGYFVPQGGERRVGGGGGGVCE